MKNPTVAIILTSLLALPGAAEAAVYTFAGGGLPISDVSMADPYPATVMVSGISANETVVDVDITISGITHTFIDDVGCLLGNPAGQFVVLFDGAGLRSEVLEQVWTFDDAASLPLPLDGDTASGRWQPNDQYSTTFPGAIPDELHPTTLATFNHVNPNGTWALYVADFVAGDSGSIGGWTLRITTAPIPEPGVAFLTGAAAVAAGLRRRRGKA